MDIKKQQINNCCLIEVIGDIDTSTSPTLQDSLDEELSQGKRLFVIDLANTRYVSSMGLRALLSHLKKLRTDQGSMVISGCNQLITDVFRMSGFLKYFELADNKDDAITRITTIQKGNQE